jgi:LysR family transcriptional regulator, transcriptional activator of nhaA
MEGLNYHHLLYFWVVAREGSIARASKLLKLAQPTISAQVHELEESLGQKLFARAGRGLALTETGQTAYGYAERIFRLGNEMVDAVRGQPAAKPVQMQVGVDRLMSTLIANRILRPALRVGERASIVVREDTLERLFAQLALGTLDLVLSDSPASAAPALASRFKVHAHVLGECSLSLFARASEAAALKRRFPRSLDGAPLLLPCADSNMRRVVARWLEGERLRPVIVGEFDDVTMMKLFGQSGCGIFPAPSPVEREVRRQYGVAMIGRIPGIRQRHYAFSAERNPRHPSVVAVLQAARATLSR